MSGPRQQICTFVTAAPWLRAVILVFAIVVPMPHPAAAAALDPVSVDPHDGIAIHGFDPVSYFASDQARQGRPDLEYTFQGATWRFSNDGNRAAFVDHPDVYAPRFGGYDPVAIARGVLVAGNPLIWIINGERLYFFYDDSARAEFAAAPVRIAETAQRRWPDVRRTLP